MRAWAKEVGINIASRGVISGQLLERCKRGPGSTARLGK
ncbi:hypothetical protein [Paenarthrobacter histidinolovorans]